MGSLVGLNETMGQRRTGAFQQIPTCNRQALEAHLQFLPERIMMSGRRYECFPFRNQVMKQLESGLFWVIIMKRSSLSRL